MKPHTQEALRAVFESTRWNWCFVFAAALPFLLLIPTAFLRGRWIGGPIVLPAMIGSWVLFCMGIGVIRNALDDYERMTGYIHYADTGLVFAPLIWGLPIAVGSSSIAGTISFVLHLFLTYSREYFAMLDAEATDPEPQAYNE